MYKKILVPLDGSATAAKAIGPAVDLARQCGNIPLVGATVTDPYPYAGLADAVPITADEYRATTTRAADAALQPLVDACKAAGLACECVVSENPHPWKALLEAAEAKACVLKSVRFFCFWISSQCDMSLIVVITNVFAPATISWQNTCRRFFPPSLFNLK